MSVPPGWGLTLTFSSYPWRLTKIAFTPENFHKIWVFPRRRIYVYLWRIWVYPWRTWVYPWRISLLLNWGGGGEVADIICITPFGTVLYPQDHCLPRGRFWVVKQRPSRLFVVGRNVAWGHKKRLGSRWRQSGPCRILTGFLAFYLFVFFLRGLE